MNFEIFILPEAYTSSNAVSNPCFFKLKHSAKHELGVKGVTRKNSQKSGNFCLPMSSMKDSIKSAGTKAAVFPVGFSKIKYKDTCQF